jgi:hypothetical protein
MSKMSLVRKVTMIATVSALALAAFSATNVFAAGSTTTATSTQAATAILEKSWKVESSAVKYEAFVLNRADRILDDRFVRNDVVTFADEGKGEALAGYKFFSLELNKANEILSTHAGFDATGKVTDQAKADKSVQDLGTYLSILRETNIYRVSIPGARKLD